MKSKILLLLLFANLVFSQQPQIYVVHGSFSDGPFSTISEAKTHLRSLISNNMQHDIYVNIPPGEYNLSDPLVFDGSDSGKNDKKVIYRGTDPNNKPVISGGQQVTGWSIHGDPSKNIWKASIGNLYSRQLYVNGQKAIRARSAVVNADNSVSETAKLIETRTGYLSICYDFTDWKNVKDMEVVSNVNWRNHRIPVESVCKNQIIVNNLFLDLVHGGYEFDDNDSNEFISAPAYWLENALELIDAPEEWYIDKSTQTLYYKPADIIVTQSQIDNLNIVIPKLDNFIVGSDVSNLNFENLVFEYSNWTRPSLRNNYLNSIGIDINNGFWTLQADAYNELDNGNSYNNYSRLSPISGAITFSECNKIKFTKNVFRHIGSTALVFGEDSSNNIICSNKFEDISASAIRVGVILNRPSTDSNPQFNQSIVNSIDNNRIENNEIFNIANEYFSSIGIFVPFAKNTTIKNNYIYNFPYTGISVGWGWNYDYKVGKNIISYNKIDCSKQIMADGAGIYTLSDQGSEDVINATSNWTKIEKNYILNQQIYLGAIYLDQASSHIHVTNNLIDISNSLSIEPKIKCRENSVSSIIAWMRSSYVNITYNLFNNKYIAPLSSVDGAKCSAGGNGCISVSQSYNTPFNGDMSLSNHDIITQSGINNSYDCQCSINNP